MTMLSYLDTLARIILVQDIICSRQIPSIASLYRQSILFPSPNEEEKIGIPSSNKISQLWPGLLPRLPVLVSEQTP